MRITVLFQRPKILDNMEEDTRSLLGSSLRAGWQGGTSGAAAMALQVKPGVVNLVFFSMLPSCKYRLVP